MTIAFSRVFSRVKRPLIVICFMLVTTRLIKLINLTINSAKMTNLMAKSENYDSDISKQGVNPNNVSMHCSFGVISDIQYADIPDGTNFARTKKRYYRGALSHLKKAVDLWTKVKVDFAVDLGDTVDGFGAEHGQSESNLNAVLDEYDKLSKPVFFHLGNHDFYNFQRQELFANKRFNSITRNKLSSSNGHSCSMYYDFSPCPGFRIVALDLYEISMLGLSKTDPNFIRAEKILRSVNPNEELNSSWNMPNETVRFVKFNGGISEGQLDWLDKLLRKADENEERVLVSGHLPVYEAATDAHCLAWNYDSILRVLHSHPSVVAYFGGHDHKGGKGVDQAGVHHITFPGVVETQAHEEAFAVVKVTPTELFIQGYGRVQSQKISFLREFNTASKQA